MTPLAFVLGFGTSRSLTLDYLGTCLISDGLVNFNHEMIPDLEPQGAAINFSIFVLLEMFLKLPPTNLSIYLSTYLAPKTLKKIYNKIHSALQKNKIMENQN